MTSFDGADAPLLFVDLAYGVGTLIDPEGTGFHLDSSILGDQIGGVLAGYAWTNVISDVNSIEYSRGAQGEIEDPQVTSCTIVFDNENGQYDPTNYSGVYSDSVYGSGQYSGRGSSNLYGDSSYGDGLYSFADPGRLAVGEPIRVRAVFNAITYDLWRGFINDITLDTDYYSTVTLHCQDAISVFGPKKVLAIPPSYDGDTTGQRINRVLDDVGWPSSLRAIDVGEESCQAATFGDSAQTILNQIVGTELGILWMDGQGKVNFYDRYRRFFSSRSTTVQASFSDLGADVDYPALTLSLTRDEIFNDAAITRNGGTEQHVTQPVSVGQYGTRTYSASIGALLRTDLQAQQMGYWIMYKYGYPDTKITKISTDALALRDMWAQILPLRPLDRIKVQRSYGPNTIIRELLILGFSAKIDPDNWTLEFTTYQPNRIVPLILGQQPGLNSYTRMGL